MFGLRAALLARGTRRTAGLALREVVRGAGEAEILLNISGMLTEPELIEQIPVRIYLDIDPAFNQLWQEACGIDMHFDGHTHFVTVGQAIGQPDCPVPTCGSNVDPDRAAGRPGALGRRCAVHGRCSGHDRGQLARLRLD